VSSQEAFQLQQLKDYFMIAVRSIRYRKVRSWLTILGIVIGISAIVSLISLGQGMQNTIETEFEKMGSDKITIMPGGEGTTMMGAFMGGLNNEDVGVVENVVGVDYTLPMLMETTTVRSRDQQRILSVTGVPFDEGDRLYDDVLYQFDPEDGRRLNKNDKYKVLIGYGFSDYLFEKKILPGNKIEINDVEFEVVGVAPEIGNRADDSSILMPLDIAREVFNTPDKVNMIMVDVKDGLDVERVAENIRRKLESSRDAEDFQVFSAQQMLEQIGFIMDVLNLVVVGIASISLIVGGIGIMNTMYVSVVERTREIGIMKAIGARNEHILMIFLIESSLLGLIGGIIGCLVGAGVAKSVEIAGATGASIQLLSAHLSPELFIGAMIFSILAGGLSGLWPARAAAKLNPVDALRYG